MSDHYKICLLGEGRVGKTSLVRRYTVDDFSEKEQTTVQVCVLFFPPVSFVRPLYVSVPCAEQEMHTGMFEFFSIIRCRCLFVRHIALYLHDKSFGHLKFLVFFISSARKT